MMTLDFQAGQFIGVLLRDHLKLTLGHLRTLILQLNHSKQNLRLGKISYSIVDFKVEIYQWLFKIGENQFDLYMRMDTNTNGHRQWFYFSIKNQLPGVIKLNVYRFKKRYSLFQRGMKPYIRSLKQKQNWKPGGNKISYRCQKQVSQYGVAKQSKSYFLRFQYKFQHPQDEVFFCSGLPYTVSYLRNRLNTFCSQELNGISCKLTKIGKSMCGQDLPLLTIQSKNETKNKNYIVINARTHAGQTSCSWVLDGLIDRIMKSEELQSWILTNNISLKIMPMLNIDGVFMGNYRTGIMGEDFNRKFLSGKKQIFPQIFALKRLVTQCKKNGKLFLFIDLHGHSILKNSFIYGPVQSLFTKNPLRTLAFTLWHSSKYFRMSSCKFKFQKDLTQTARVYFQIKETILTYTCQISLGLYYQNGRTIQFTEEDYKLLGQSMADSFSELLTKQKIQNYQQQILPMHVIEPSTKFATATPKDFIQKSHNNTKYTALESSKIKEAYFPSFKKQKQINLLKNGNIEMKNKKIRESKEKVSKLERIERKPSQLKFKHSQDIEEVEERIGQTITTREKKASVLSQPKDYGIANKNKSSFDINKTLKSIKNQGTPSNKIQQATNSQLIKLQERDERSKILQNKRHQLISKSRKRQKQKTASKKGRDKEENNSIFGLHQSQSKKSTKQSSNQYHFKIRRKSDILKVLPESLRKKVATKAIFGLNTTSKYLQDKPNSRQEEQQSFVFERSVTYDPAYTKNPTNETITQPNQLQIINEKFSQDYESINDEDSSQEDLCDKQKQYLLECIRNNRKLHTYIDSNDEKQSQQEDYSNFNQTSGQNINGFRQIRFKSIDTRVKLQSNGNQNAKAPKRQPYKFRDFTHKSLCRNYFDEQTKSLIPPTIVQKKQLNERVHRKTQREPYFLIQIKNKNN